MCAQILHVRLLLRVGAHGLLGRTWGPRQAQDVARSRPETFVPVQDAEVFARSAEGFAFTDPLRFAEQPGQPGLAFDFMDVHGTVCENFGQELGYIFFPGGLTAVWT